MLATEVYGLAGTAVAAKNPSDRDEFAAKAAPTLTAVQIKTAKQVFASVFSVTSVTKFSSYQPTKPGQDPLIR